MPQIFISYSHSDADFVTSQLVPQLQEIGIEAWLDTTRLNLGDNWRKEIDDGIRNSDAIIVVLSPDADQSKYVTYEWAYAWGAEKRVFPIVLRKVEILHPRLVDWQHIDFTDYTRRDWEKLKSDIKKYLEDEANKERYLSQKTIEYYINMLLDNTDEHENRDNGSFQQSAARVLGSKRVKQAVRPLILALHTYESEQTILSILTALGMIGEEEAVPDIEEYLYYSNIYGDKSVLRVRYAAERALRRINTKYSMAVLKNYHELHNNSSDDQADISNIPF